MKKYIVMGSIAVALLVWCIYFFGRTVNEKIIVLDPGHGGKYPGFETNGLVEKNIVLKVSDYIKDQLERKGYKVYMTRTADKECSSKGYIKDLSCRPKLARKVHADLFISIHANAFADDFSVRGVEAFYFTPFRDKEAADMIGHALAAETNIPLRFVKFGNYQVLRESLVPATLIEMGYLTNKEDAKLLSSDEGQKRAALGIVKGIEELLRINRQ